LVGPRFAGGLRFLLGCLVLALLGAAAYLGLRGERSRTPPPAIETGRIPPPEAAVEAPAPAPKPRADDRPVERAPAPPADAGGQPAEATRSFVEAHLRSAFETHLPRYKLTDEQFQRLTDVILRIRAARQALNALPLDASTAETHRKLREELARAVADFKETADVDLSEFTELAEPESGITREENDRDVIVHEPLPDPPPVR
jgi:hypothetical protein